MKKIIKEFKEKVLNNKRNLKIFILVIVIICTIILLLSINNKGFNISLSGGDSAKIKREYASLNNEKNEEKKEYPKVDISRNNKFQYTNINEIINVFNNKKDAVIYFGYASCVYCRTAIQILDDTAKDTEIDKILYLDVENKIDGYDKLFDVLDDRFINTENNDKKVYSPLVLFVVDGKIVSYHKGTLFSQDDPFKELDKSQIAGLSEIYKYGIQDVIKGLKNN